MTRKYEFTGERINWKGRVLHRIKRLADGKVGGFIEKEDNLSHYDDCWIDDNAKVYDNARVSGNAFVFGDAEIYDNAEVYCSASVLDFAEVSMEAKVTGDCEIRGYAQIYGEARVSGTAVVEENAEIFEDAHVCGDSRVLGNACILGSAIVCSDFFIDEDAFIYGQCEIRNGFSHGETNINPLSLRGSLDLIRFLGRDIVQIGCQNYTIDFWLNNYQMIGRKYSYSEDQIKEYGQLLLYMKNWIETIFKPSIKKNYQLRQFSK
jgi:NDP-sugar pyrophosphorylase family protein